MSDTPTHRLAAVWFADISGFTRLTSEDEPLALQVVEVFQRCVREAVDRSQGVVVKFLGDGGLARFPSADDAVSAALALRQRFLRATETLRGAPYPLHQGVHLGEITLTSDGDVIGDGVNRASRVQDAAGPDQILVSEDVWRALRQRPDFRFQEEGEHEAKGIGEPLKVLSVVGSPALLSRLARAKPPAKEAAKPAEPFPRARNRYSRAVAVGMLTGLITFGGLLIWTAMDVARETSGIDSDNPGEGASSDSTLATPGTTEEGQVGRQADAEEEDPSTVAVQPPAATEEDDPPPGRELPPDEVEKAFSELLLRAIVLLELGETQASRRAELIRRLREGVSRYLAQYPDRGEPHAAQGLIHYLFDWNWSGAGSELRQGVALSPSNPTIRLLHASYLTAQARFTEAWSEIETARELDSSFRSLVWQSANTLFRARRYDEAQRILEKVVEGQAGNVPARILLARVQIQSGQPQQAIQTLAPAARGSRSPTAQMWTLYAQLSRTRTGRPNRPQQSLPTFQDEKSPDTPYYMAMIYGKRGDLDQAFRSLEQAVQAHAPSLIWLKVDPELDSLRPDGRFAAILRQVGLTP